MTFYKKSLLSLIVLASLATTACFKPQAKNADQMGDDDTASFFVEDVKGVSAVTEIDPTWGFPKAKLFSFTVCSRDNHSQESIRGHKFKILDGSKKVIGSAVTRTDGCLTWNETIKYNFLADQKYIPFTRYVRADGIHTGQKKVKIGINPWLGTDIARAGLADVVDLSRQKLDPSYLVSESESLLYLNGEKKASAPYRKLYVDGMIVSVSNVGAGTAKANTTLKLDMAPQILLHNINNKIYGMPLNKGKFRIVAHLISRIDEGEKVRRTYLGSAAYAKENAQELVGERLRFDLPFTQTYKSGMGQLELAVKLIPEGAPGDLAPFEGVFFLGSYKTQTVFSGNVPTDDTLKYNYTYKIEDYLKTVQRPDPKHLPNGIFPLQPIEFSMIEFPFTEIQSIEETPTKRTISILMKTTVTNPLENNDILRNLNFKVSMDGAEVDSPTYQQGVLSWRLTMSYKTYAARRYFFKEITIRYKPDPNQNTEKCGKGEFCQTLAVRINPWAKAGFALGNDLRQLDVQSRVDVLKQKKYLQPQIVMGKYVFALNENVRYRVNQDLSIDSYKSFIVNLAPYLLAYSDPIDGVEASSPFRDGLYLLKVALESSTIDGVKYVSTVKKLVNLRNGQINEPVTLRVPDLRQMRIRNLVYVELHPVDYKKLTPRLIITKGIIPKQLLKGLPTNLDDLIEKDSGLEPRTFVGVFTPFSAKGEGPLRPTDDMDEQLQDPGNIEDEEEVAANKHIKPLLDQGKETLKYNDIDGLIPIDDPRETFKQSSAYQKLLQDDATFAEGSRFNNNGEILEFLTRMRIKDYNAINISKLEAEEKAVEEANRKLAAQRFNLDQFVDHANADFIVVKNVEETYKNFPKLKNQNMFLPAENSLNTLVTKLNENTRSLFGFGNKPFTIYPDHKNGMSWYQTYSVTPAALVATLPQINGNRIVEGAEIDPLLATRFCRYWVWGRYPNIEFSNSLDLIYKCIEDARAISATKPFVLDQKLRIFKRGRYEKSNGYYTRLNVNSDVRVGFGHGNSQSSGWSFSPMSLLGFTSFKWLSFLGVGVNGHQAGEGYDTNEGKSSSLGAGSSISGEEAQLNIIIKEYERCSIIRMNPEWMNLNRIANRVKTTVNDSEKSALIMKSLTRGVMICSGVLENNPLIIKESIFYMTPDPFDGSLLEITDPKNYPWVVTFRGHRDYGQFLDILKTNGIKSGKNLAELDLKDYIDLVKKTDVNQHPTGYIDPSIRDFKNSAGGVVTTYPGVYTVP